MSTNIKLEGFGLKGKKYHMCFDLLIYLLFVLQELSEDVHLKSRLIEQLEDKYDEEQTKSCHSAALIRSLETQLVSSENVIRGLKKEVNEAKLPESNTRLNPRDQFEFTSSSESLEPLRIADLQSDANENRADEIFQRSRALRARKRHSMMVMPTTQEETESSEESDQFITRTYSLRQKSERRRSFQPRRYMGGLTPPGKRTLIGEPSQTQINNFSSLDTADEPEVMDDMEWGRIRQLKDEVSIIMFVYIYLFTMTS